MNCNSPRTNVLTMNWTTHVAFIRGIKFNEAFKIGRPSINNTDLTAVPGCHGSLEVKLLLPWFTSGLRPLLHVISCQFSTVIYPIKESKWTLGFSLRQL